MNLSTPYIFPHRISRWCAALLVCLAIIAPQSATAQTFPANGDTISIGYPYSDWYGNTTTRYMRVSNNSLGYATSTDVTTLWRVEYESNGTDFRLCNINSEKWLAVSISTSGWNRVTITPSLASSKNNSNVFSLSAYSNSDWSETDQRAKKYLQYTYNGTPYYIYYYYGGWSTNTNITSSSPMQIERWSKTTTTSVSIVSDPDSHTFLWNKTGGTPDVEPVSYEVQLISDTYIYNVPGSNPDLGNYNTTKLNQDTTATYNPDDIKDAGYALSWYWKSRQGETKRDTSYLTADLIHNSVDNTSFRYEEKPRPMMFLSDPSSANNKTNYSLNVTTVGPSPFNVMTTNNRENTLRYADFSDELILSVTHNGQQVATRSVYILRQAFHYVYFDDMLANLEPPTYYFPAQASTSQPLQKQFAITLQHIQGDVLFDKDGNTAEDEHGQVIYDKRVQTNLDRNAVNEKQVTFLNPDGSTAQWLSYQLDENTPLIVTAEPNNTQSMRRATLQGSFKYKGTDDAQEHHKIFYASIFQYSTNETGERKFRAYKGFANDALDADGRQRVHQLEKTIYYRAGEEILLQLNETKFIGYMRWYDYQTGKAPQYNSDGTEVSNFWVQRSQVVVGNNVTNFTAINSDGETSHGLYATYTDALSPQQGQNDNYIKCPKFRGWSDRQERRIACDVSAYTDYVISDTCVQEPTLSYRQIFHLIPAERMADSLSKFTTDQDRAFEEYYYIAPAGKDVLLETRYAYNHYIDHASELCYYFYGKNNQLTQFGSSAAPNAQWYSRKSTETDYTSVTINDINGYAHIEHGNTVETVIYELRIPAKYTQSNKDIRLARFTVEYMDRNLCGPRDDSTHIITDQEIARNYTNVVKQDFNFGKKPAGTATEYLDRHLNWDEASYGYTYVSGKVPYQRVVNNPFPYYGEYCLTNRVGATSVDTWLDDTPQHGGAANGYCMYVDGGLRPGLVASISTEQRICSGLQLYCYAWICNPSHDAAGITANLPIFRFNVQGRNKDANGNYGDWEDIGVFFAGTLPYAGGEAGWRQVFFPLVSANDYDESRVSIYNFANSNQGNDFLIDDICLFASKLPLAAYQVMTSCASENREAAVARVDYTRLTGDWGCKPIYYQIYDLTDNKPVKTDYYNKFAEKDSTHGCIIIPQNDYDPAKTNDANYRQDHTCMKNVDESKSVFTSVTAFVDSMSSEFTRLNGGSATGIQEVTMKAYVKTTENGKERYVLYVGHILGNSKLDANHSYEIRMADEIIELANPDCALRTPLPVYDKTALNVNNQTSPVIGACANDLYPVEVRVTNTTDDNKTIYATTKADWLLAYRFDDCFNGHFLEDGNRYVPTAEEKAKADTLFLHTYGYLRGKVEDAIKDMRRLPTDTLGNPNYFATDVSQLDPKAFHNEDAYPLIKDLCDRGLLRLSIEFESFYMPAADTVRYWIYPILGTAVYTDLETHKSTTLTDCDEPMLLYISTANTDYVLNLSPIPYNQMTDDQRAQLPNIRVSASMANTEFCVPVSNINGVALGWDSCQVVSTTDSVIAPLIGTSEFSMHYTQDKIWGQGFISESNDYYQNGGTIRFRPVDTAHVAEMQRLHDANPTLYHDNQPGLWRANTHTMRPGCEYTMRLQLMDRSTSAIDTSGCKVGTAYFNVIIIPDTMVWRPTYGNEWGDDRNWRAVINGVEQDFGFAPLPQTLVIIPQLESGAATGDYPRITTRNLYPMDANYVPNQCRKIHFNPRTRLLNQHLLAYDSAFVDMTLPQGSTYFVSAPVQDMYSGDLFVPHTGNMYSGQKVDEPDHFEVSNFKGTRSGTAAYAFYPSYYNHTVSIIHSSDKISTVTGTASFSWSNTLDEPLSPGMGYAVSGYGPGNDSHSDLKIRLPKPDNEYFYYDENGNSTSHKVTLTRTNAHKLAYPLNGDYTFTLTNAGTDTTFLFGNPTMAYIDMAKFVDANNTILKNHFRTLIKSEWRTVPLQAMSDPTQRFIDPMQSVLLTTYLPAQEIKLTLSPEHLSVSNAGTTAPDTSDPQPAPARHAPADGHTVQSEVMDIIACYRGRAAYATLAKLDFAANGYDADEDVPFISSGIEDKGNAVTTPVNIYTVAGSQTLMADIRSDIGIVPVGFLLKSRTDSIYISFHTTANWTSECYFCDVLTGTKFPIYNDSRFHIATPADHELRYYIQGPYQGPGPVTGFEDTGDGNGTTIYDSRQQYLTAFSSSPQTATLIASGDMAEVNAYDLAGRLLLSVSLPTPAPVTTISLPSGIALLKVRLTSGITLQTKLIVQ